MRLRNDAGTRWVYDGSPVTALGRQPLGERDPAEPLKPEPFVMELVNPHLPLPQPDELAGAPPTTSQAPIAPPPPDVSSPGWPSPVPYRPTHVVPATGAWAWEKPDPKAEPVAELDPGLDVKVVEARADGWARIECSNAWSAWVDSRLLVPRPDS